MASQLSAGTGSICETGSGSGAGSRSGSGSGTVRIAILSAPEEFPAERRHLLEFVLPELQRHHLQRGIEVELVCPLTSARRWQPHHCADLREELADCHRVSRPVFAMFLVGEQRGPFAPPSRLTLATFDRLRQWVAGDTALLESTYSRDDNAVPPELVYSPRREKDKENDPSELVNLLRRAEREGIISFPSVLEDLVEMALGLSDTAPERCLVAVRAGAPTDESPAGGGARGVVDRRWGRQWRQRLLERLPPENVLTLGYPAGSSASPATSGQLQQFSSDVIQRIRQLVLQRLPDSGEDMSPATWPYHTELLSCLERRWAGPPAATSDDLTPGRVADWVRRPAAASERPLIITGPAGSGKTWQLALLAQSLTQTPTQTAVVVRRFRPGNSLLHRRQQLQQLATEARQRLRQVCGSSAAAAEGGGLPDGRVVVLLDDVDVLLAPSELERGAAGATEDAWLAELTLPGLLVVVTATSLVQLRGERWRAEDDTNVAQLAAWTRGEVERALDAALEARARTLSQEQREDVLSRCAANPTPLFVSFAVEAALHARSFETAAVAPRTLEEHHREAFDRLERRLGADLVAAVCRYVTLSHVGLVETELCDLLSSADLTPPTAAPPAGHGPPADWIALKSQLAPLWSRQWRHHRLVLGWRHQATARYVRGRYLADRDLLRTAHTDLSNLHLLGFLVTADDMADDGQPTAPEGSHQKTLQFLRLADGLWHHLLYSGDLARLKLTILCNFRYMWQSVRLHGPQHLYQVVAATRHWFLDWETELVHHALQKVTELGSDWRDQLAPQLLIWLHNFAGAAGSPLAHLLGSVVGWCVRQTAPLLVPATVWIRHCLPDTVCDLTLPAAVLLYEPAPDGVHVYTACGGRCFHLWHMLSSRLVHTFSGHTGDVTCVFPSADGRHVVSGAEDCHVIVWSAISFLPLLTIDRHIACVLCVAAASLVSRGDVVVSGGEDSCLYVTRLTSADGSHGCASEPRQLSQHRGPVTCLQVNSESEVMASGSHDKTVLLWSLETLTVLNEISLPSAVSHMSVSGGAMFLLTACLDMTVYVHSFTTGSPLHTLKNHQSQVTSVTSSEDGNLCVVGCRDTKVYVYDIPSARLLRTLTKHGSPVLSSLFTSHGNLLITAGASRVLVTHVQPLTVKPKVYVSDRKKISVEHTADITCLDISADQTMVVTGSRDSHLKVWLVPSGDLHATLEGHTGAVTCVQFAPNGLFAVSGSQDSSVRVWGLTLNMVVSAFTDHKAPVVSVCVLSDSKQTLSADKAGVLMLWQVETGIVLLTCQGPGEMIRATPNRSHAVSGNSDGNQLFVWTLRKDNTKNTIGHNDVIRCFDVSSDSAHVITGSNDASLKVWTIAEGRLTQVLVGHEAAVTSTAYPAYVSHTAASGGDDCLVMAWDVDTGQTRQVIRDHSAPVTAVCMTADAGMIISGSSTGWVFVHTVASGQKVTSIALHTAVAGICISADAGKLAVRLRNSMYFALLSFLNVPPLAQRARPRAVAQPIAESRKQVEAAAVSPAAGRRPPPHRRPLKKGISLDTYTWQRKYGGILSKMAPLSPVNGEKPKRKVCEEEVRMCPEGGTIHPSQQMQSPVSRRTDSREHLATAPASENGSSRVAPPPPPAVTPKKRELSRTSTALVLTMPRRVEEPAAGAGSPSAVPESLLRLRRPAGGCGPAGDSLRDLVHLLHRPGPAAQRSKFCCIL